MEHTKLICAILLVIMEDENVLNLIFTTSTKIKNVVQNLWRSDSRVNHAHEDPEPYL